MNTKIDNYGRVLIPKKMRVELCLSRGSPVSIESNGEAITLKSTEAEPNLVYQGGILVYCGKDVGNLGDAIEQQRDERIESLSF